MVKFWSHSDAFLLVTWVNVAYVMLHLRFEVSDVRGERGLDVCGLGVCCALEGRSLVALGRG